MKIAIATPEQAGPDWFPFDQVYQTPQQNYYRFSQLPADAKICTFSIEILNLCGSDPTNAPYTYEDVYVPTENGLTPILNLHSFDWLVQSKLGTLFLRGFH